MITRIVPTFLTLLLLTVSSISFAQAPAGVNYQAVARDGNGDVLVNENLNVRMSIKESGPAGTTVYQETHNTTTNDFGLFDLVIGQGSVVTGVFGDIDWGSNSHFLQVEVDDGSGYVNLGTTQFVSVPYALYAKEAGNAGTSYNAGAGIDISGNTISNTGDTDPTDDLTNTSNAGGDVTGTFNNLTVEGIQGNSVSGNAPAPGEVLKWNGSAWAPANDVGGGSGDDWGTQVVQSDATLSGNGVSGNELGIASQGASSGQVLQWNGSAWVPAADENTTYSDGTGLNLSGTTFNAMNTSAMWNANQLQGNDVSNTSPSSGEVLKWNGSAWAPATDATGGGGTSPWQTSGSDIYYNNGNVGIGTNTPDEIFHVSNSSGSYIKSEASSGPAYFEADGSNNAGLKMRESGSVKAYVYWNTSEQGLSFHENGGDQATIKNGNFGIGTSAPDNKLTVSGDANVTGNLGINETNPSAPLHITMTGTALDDGIQLRSSQGTNEDWYFYMPSNENLTIRDDASDVFTIENGTGNIGIGTTNPSHRLHVEGGKAMIGSPNGVIAKLTVNAAASGEEIFRARKGGSTQFLIDEDGNIDFRGDSMLFNMDAIHDLVVRFDGTEPQIIPYGNFSTNGEIGSTSNPFYQIYSEYFYASSSGNYSTYSDSRIKENVTSLESPVEKISALNGVQYDLTQAHYNRNGEPRDKDGRFNHIGLIAQDVEKVFPGLVQKDEKTGLKTVGYMGLIPVLVEGMKVQQSEIDMLTKENEDLQEQLNDLKQRVEMLEK